MADGSKSGGDWTAGIVAILAALLLGAALPIGLYFGLYKPMQADRMAAEKKLEQLEIEKEALIAKQAYVSGLQEDADKMAERVRDLEADFVQPDATDTNELDIKEVRRKITELAEQNGLTLRRERAQQKKAVMVYPARQRVTFEHGLNATGIMIEAQAAFHDFGRFLAAMEDLDNTVIIPESLLCKGDANRGTKHVFQMTVFVVERRDISAIGQ